MIFAMHTVFAKCLAKTQATDLAHARPTDAI